MIDAMIAIAEDLRQMFSRKSDAVENLAAHAVTCAVLECYSHRSAYAFLNILYRGHITQF